MKTLKMTMLIEEKEGYIEAEMLKIIRNNLSEVKASAVRYQKIVGGYKFEIDFESLIAGISYQPILGCFTTIDLEYDKVRLVGIPQDQIEII